MRRCKRLKSSPFTKSAVDNGSSKRKGVKVMVKVMINVDKEIPSPFELLDDELQSFPSEGRALISLIMDFIVWKSFTKPIPRSSLEDDVRLGMYFLIIPLFVFFSLP